MKWHDLTSIIHGRQKLGEARQPMTCSSRAQQSCYSRGASQWSSNGYRNMGMRVMPLASILWEAAYCMGWVSMTNSWRARYRVSSV